MVNTLSNIFYLAYPSLCEILSIPFSSSALNIPEIDKPKKISKRAYVALPKNRNTLERVFLGGADDCVPQQLCPSTWHWTWRSASTILIPAGTVC